MAATGCVAAMLVFGLLATPVRTLRVVRDPGGDNTPIACVRVGQGTSFVLSFTHSMYGGRVHETWNVTVAGNLVRTDVRTDNAAAAEYYASDGRVTAVDGQYVVHVEPLTVPRFTVRLDQVGQQRLRVGHAEYVLIRADEPSAPARVDTTSRPLLAVLAGRVWPGTSCG